MTCDLTTYTSYNRVAPSARVRVFDWVEYLELKADFVYPDVATHSGRNLASMPLVYGRHLGRLARSQVDSHPVLVQREASPFGRGAIEKRLLSQSPRGVYDFDDALHLVPARWGRRRADRWRESVLSARLVVASNAFLAAQASTLNPCTVVIPSCVRADRYVVKNHYDRSEDSFRAVWIGSSSTEKYLLDVMPAFEALSAGRNVSLTIIGSRTSHPSDPDFLTREKWKEGLPEVQLSSFDVGIMPLWGGPWELGKAAYKLLQYGAAGLPVVGSDVGLTGELLRSWGAPAVTSPQDWLGSLDRLRRSKSQREAIGRAAHRDVMERYSYSANALAWSQAVLGR